MVVLNCEQVNNIEKQAVKNGDSFLRLMQNAGKNVADFINEKLLEYTQNVVIVCGKGNNGGDGFVVAELLHDKGINVCVVLACKEPTTDIASFYFNRIKEKQINILKYDNEDNISKNYIFNIVAKASLIIDCIFGIGFKGCVRENLIPLFDSINKSKSKVVSVDVPSGLSCDALPIEGAFIKPDYTVTFSTLKPVNVLYPTADYCGKVVVRDVGINTSIIENSEKVMSVIDKSFLEEIVKPRKLSANKGSFGRLLCICGKVGMSGAAMLATKSAIKSGVGLVELATVNEIYPIIASQLAEPVFTMLKSSKNGTISKENTESIINRLKVAKACLIGCGLGVDNDTKAVLKSVLLNSEVPLIIDADAINLIAEDTELLKKAQCPLILTPHPGEMARLVNISVEKVQLNRVKVAKDFAETYNVYLVLKGANTLIATPKGELFVNITGNPGMAKGGSGDVLAGIISSFISQGIDLKKAIGAAVYTHGAVGDICAGKYSQVAMTPSDIINELSGFYKLAEHEKGCRD